MNSKQRKRLAFLSAQDPVSLTDDQRKELADLQALAAGDTNLADENASDVALDAANAKVAELTAQVANLTDERDAAVKASTDGQATAKEIADDLREQVATLTGERDAARKDLADGSAEAKEVFDSLNAQIAALTTERDTARGQLDATATLAPGSNASPVERAAATEIKKAKALDNLYAEWLREQRIPMLTREAWGAKFAPNLLPGNPAKV